MDKGIEIAYNRFIQRLEIYGYELSMPIEWFVVFSRKTQAQMLFWHLEKFGKVTREEADEIYGIGHTPSVIRDLRDMFREKHAPFYIKNITIDGYNRWGKKTRYDEYTLRSVDE